MNVKHTRLSENNLARAIAAATMAEAIEKREEKEREDTDGISGLPPGHPVRVMMEQAKERLEGKKKFEAEQQDAVAKQKIRKARKANETFYKDNERKVAEEKRDKVASLVNVGIDRVSGEIVKLGKHLDSVFNEFDNFPRSKVKATRLKRFLLAIYRGVQDCRLDVKTSFNDESKP